VIISRSELIQIGGGFRIPDILESTGAVLREVGTTNKTTIQDYQRAISSRTAMILKVHQSNFYMTGFVQSPTTEELAQLAGNSQLPILEDLGSGAVIDTATWPGVPAEPTPQAQLKSGLDLVCFSGDKLFGGPQAGILAGRAHHIAALKKNQFFRCLRSDKLILAGIEHVAEQYLNQTHNHQNHLSSNVDKLASISVEALQKRASMISHHFTAGPGEVACIDCLSTLGGGTLPKAGIPSAGITWRVPGWTAEKLQHAFLRHPSIPVIGRIERDNFITDLRTVFPSQDGMLVSAFQSIVIGQK
ncbi:MAG: L-seryl-tRNA(Sec) selenium transferase, partial [Verrucomicrobia bacterium]|nr:L-seryl-tRNA(Sec) selenium transferase [Verrucomicrobiota bacterium]